MLFGDRLHGGSPAHALCMCRLRLQSLYHFVSLHLQDCVQVCESAIVDVRGVCCSAEAGLDACGYCAGAVIDTSGATVRVGFDGASSCCAGSEGVFLTGDWTCCGGPELVDECATAIAHQSLVHRVAILALAILAVPIRAQISVASLLALTPTVEDVQCLAAVSCCNAVLAALSCCNAVLAACRCGVCGGTGSTCQKIIETDITFEPGVDAEAGVNATAEAIAESLPEEVTLEVTVEDFSRFGVITGFRRRLRADAPLAVTFTLQASSANVSTGQLAGYYTQAASSSELIADAGTVALRVSGQADNGLCEIGEPEDSADCILPLECPVATATASGLVIGNHSLACAGAGVCSGADGTCVCARGYSGPACDRCDTVSGFAEVQVAAGRFACTKLASDFTASSTLEVNATRTGSDKSGAGGGGGGARAARVAAAVAASLLGCLLWA